jgi:hypothetical protein
MTAEKTHYSDLSTLPYKTIRAYGDRVIWEGVVVTNCEYRSKNRSIPTVSINLPVDIAGEVLLVSDELSRVVAEIEESRSILDLQEGWDDNRARKISSEIWTTSAKFLLRYAEFVKKNLETIIEPPEINPCINGSIDLSWRTKGARLLINIRREGNDLLAFYYGDKYNKEAIKGAVSTIGVESHLGIWMKNLV